MNLTLRISDLLKDMGIPASLRGYRYLRYAVEISVESPEYIDQLTTVLYPNIAARFKTTSSRVERSIRHAIEVGWDRGNVENQERLFGYTVSADRGKPTNGEFISTLVDFILMTIEEDSHNEAC